MRRRAGPDRGFVVALLINMLFRPEWPILALIMLALHLLFGLPALFIWLCLGIWVVWSAVVTAFVSWAAGCSRSNPTPGGTSSSRRGREKEELERELKRIRESKEAKRE